MRHLHDETPAAIADRSKEAAERHTAEAKRASDTVRRKLDALEELFGHGIAHALDRAIEDLEEHHAEAALAWRDVAEQRQKQLWTRVPEPF